MTRLATAGLAGRLKFLAKDTAVYGLGGALNRLVALVTFPFLARHFSVAEFGLIDIVNTGVVLLVTLLVFGQDSAVARYFYEDEDPEARRQLISQSLLVQGGCVLLVLPVLWLLTGSIAATLDLNAEARPLLQLAILQGPFFLLVTFSQGLLKWTLKRNQFLIVSIGSTLATALAMLVGIASGRLGLIDVFLVYLSVRAIFGLLGLWFIREWLTVPRGLGKVRMILPFALPYGVICVVTSALPLFERGQVQSILGQHELGLYAAGAKVAQLISLPITAFEMVWAPFALMLMREADAGQSYRMGGHAFAAFLFAAVLGLTAIAEPTLRILGSEPYVGGAMVVLPLALALAFQSVGATLSVGIVISKRSHLALYGYGVLMLTAAFVIPLLTREYGMSGAAWGSVLAMAAKSLVEIILGQRAHAAPWGYSQHLILLGAVAFFGVMHQWFFGRFAVVGVALIPLAGAVVVAALGVWLTLENKQHSLPTP